MKKILYINYIPQYGHVNFDTIHVHALEQAGARVSVVMHASIARRLPFPGEKYAMVLPAALDPGPEASPLKNRIYYARTLLYLSRHIDFRAYDGVVLSSFEEISLALVPLCRGKLLVSHGNVASLDNAVKAFFLRRIAKSNGFIVFNDTMRRHYVHAGFKRVFTVSHGCVPPFPPAAEAVELPYDKADYDMVAFHPSAAPDPDFVARLVADGDFLETLRRERILLILRGNAPAGLSSNNIMFLPGYLHTPLYRALFMASRAIIMAYPPSFRYRVSGVSFECVANGKAGLVLDMPSLRYCRAFFNYDPFFRTPHDLAERLIALKRDPQLGCTASPDALSPDYGPILGDICK